MKRFLLVLFLLALPAFAQRKTIDLPQGKIDGIRLANSELQRARYRISATYPVTIFFGKRSDLDRIKKYDPISTLGPCAVIHARVVEVWCSEQDNFDTLFIMDDRDTIGAQTNKVTVVRIGVPPEEPNGN